MRYEICSECQKEKHETEFYSNGSGKLRSSCKDCTKASRRSEAYKAAQLAYDRSDKGRERKRRYNVSDLGRARNQDHYYLHRDERIHGVKFAKFKRTFVSDRGETHEQFLERRRIENTNSRPQPFFFKILDPKEYSVILGNGSGPYGGEEGEQ